MASGRTISKEIPITGGAITYKGVFDMKKLYEFLHDWLYDEGFRSQDGHCSPNDFERFFWQRTNAQGMTDYSIWWRMKKSPDDYETSWFEYRLNLDFLGIAISKADVMHEGKKLGAYKGEINLFISPKLILDPKGQWMEDSLASRFGGMFRARTYKKEIKFHKDILEELSFKFQESVKAFFGLTTLTDPGEPFHPERGLGWS